VQNDLPLTYYDGYVSQVMHVTPRDVSAVAAKYLDLSHLVVVVSGDRKMLQPMLEAAKLGAVVVVDK
jgi:predicted Zn-dependent peptidase